MASVTVSINSNNSVTFNYTVTNVSDTQTRLAFTSASFKSIASNGLTRSYFISLTDNLTNFHADAYLLPHAKNVYIGYSGSVTYSRTKAAQTKTCRVVLQMDSEDGKYSYAKNASFTVTIPAKTSWNVSYNANGGSAISGTNPDKKWYGESLKLKSGNAWTNYTFAGWNTKSDGTGTTYAAGYTYTANAALTLYSKWTRTVSYDANGGTGTPSSQTALRSAAMTLSTARPSRTGYVFKGWATSAGATSAGYQPGATYAANNPSMKLYAIWGAMITAIRAERCDQAGNLDDEGEYMKLVVSWNKSPNADSTAPTLSLSVSPSVTVTNPTLSGTSGTNQEFVVAGPFDASTRYVVTATLADSMSSYTVSTYLDTAYFIMDVLAGGHGITFGGAAKEEGFHVKFPVHCDQAVLRHSTTVADAKVATSSTSVITNMSEYDGLGQRVGYSEVVRTDTGVYRSFAVQNPKTGTVTGIYLYADDAAGSFNGRRYGFTDSAAFRSALLLGQLVSDEHAIVSVASGAWTQLASVSLAAGKWLILTCYYIAGSNTTGSRQFTVTSATSASGPSLGGSVILPPTTLAVYGVLPVFVQPSGSSNTVYRTFGYQSSGSAQSMRVFMRAVRVG